MNIVYEPIWASQERWNLNLVKPKLKCGPNEEAEALEQGWLIYQDEWYLSRSVRVSTTSILQSIPGYTHEVTSIVSKEELEIVWYDYLERKHLPEYYQLWADTDRTKWLLLRNANGELVSFTKFLLYQNNIESCLNAYLKVPGSIGKRMLELEISWANLNGYKNLYIGTGCEQGSRYKADVPGFEYWTGTTWSSNKLEYRNLCSRDSEVQTMNHLNALWNSNDINLLD